MKLSLVNGLPATQIDLSDRGFSYGDGVFETMLVADDKPLLLERHMKRLKSGLDRLFIDYNQSFIETILSEIELLIEQGKRHFSASERLFLKLVVSRGSGGRGYRAEADLQPTRALMLSTAAAPDATMYQQGCELFACQTRLGHNPQLAGIKHLNRLEQVLARNEWQDQYHEGLVCDLDGRLIEGTMSNLFLVKDQQLLTPRLDRCGVNGIVRSVVIDSAEQQGVTVIEQSLHPEDLLRADGAFITNTGFGVLPVKAYAGQAIPLSPVTAIAAQWLQEARQCES